MPAWHPRRVPDSDGHENPVVREVKHLEQVAEEGESNETPLIAGVSVFLVAFVVFLLMLASALIAYRLA
jgi:hypothetical protein